MRMALIDGPPGFCDIGWIKFQSKMGHWIVVSKTTGAVLSKFTYGKLDFYTFRSPLWAIRAAENAGVKGCLVRLRSIQYFCQRPSKKAGFYKCGKMGSMECYDFAPPGRGTRKIDSDWVNFDWANNEPHY